MQLMRLVAFVAVPHAAGSPAGFVLVQKGAQKRCWQPAVKLALETVTATYIRR